MEKIDFQEEINRLAGIILQQGHTSSYFNGEEKVELSTLNPQKADSLPVVNDSNSFKPTMMSSYFDSFDASRGRTSGDNVALATAVNLWLISNKGDIETLDDFRDKLDKFSSVLCHPLYIEMEGNLCVSATINGFLGKRKSQQECREVLEVMGYKTDLGEDELDIISRDRYNNASKSFEKLVGNEEVQNAAKACKFAMNFNFTGDYADAERLYDSVSIFSAVSDQLEQIFTNKSNLLDSKKHK